MQAGKTTSLYERWQAIVAEKATALAVREPACHRNLTFAELEELARQAPAAPPLLQTNATGLALVVDVLRAWRDGSVLLPDDSGSMAVPETNALPEEVCHLKVTSGSSGQRRCVMFQASHLMADAAQIVSTMQLRAETPNLAVISQAHSYGFSNLVLPLLLHGIPVWFLENPLPETLRSALRQSPAHTRFTLPAVPAMWRAWHRADVDFSRVALAISAGAPLPLELEQAEYLRSGLKIHNFYGSSECGGIAFDATPQPRSDASLAGTPMDGVTVRLHNGCLRAESPAAGLGNVGSPESCTPGYFQTQDLARIGENGAIHLLGRSSDVISVAGYKVAPEMVENAVQQIAGVRCCVAFGVPSSDPVRQEEVVVCVNHDPDHSLNAIRQNLTQLPSACVPRHWLSCPDLMPDARGKLSRPAWRQRWLATRDSISES